ncbi:MAG: (d)CMP kinase, partial [Bacilli bacterium]|nr:(d)CMP kinase [Bacilli bacterium]
MGWQIAIDGPAASGKSTVAKAIAKNLHFEYLDTGAMYRAVALKATRLGVNLEDEESYKFLDSTTIDFIDSRIYLDGEDVSEAIRNQEMSNKASYVSMFGYVRKVLVAMQQKLASSKNIVMDGRDIGTVVLPNANLKIFLVADVEVRAKRSLKERFEKTGETVALEDTIEELKARDLQDSTRANSPLKQAEDAVYLDTSKLSVNEVIEEITNLVFKRGYSMENLEKNVNVEETEVEETPVEKAEEAVEEVVAEVAAEEVVEEAVEEGNKYKEMQVVKGVVVEVQEAQPAKKIGQKEIKAKEERVLIELPDGQEGYLFRKDTADIQDDEDLFDVFVEGDEVEVVIKKIFPDGGKFIFSTALIAKRNELLAFEETIKERPILTAKVIKKVSDFGLLMKYEDFTCLLPTQLTATPKEEFDSLIGKELEVVPVRVDLSRIRIIVSEIHATSKKQKAAKKEFLSKIEVGQVYEGVVKNIESYGAFVELGEGVEGLLHISEVDHNRISKIEKVLNTGDTVKVQVIKVEKDHIGLSRKALMTNHWAEYFDGKELGDVVTGKVVEINKAGVRVDLATEIEGFVPKSEFSWERNLVLEDAVKVGDELTGKLIEVAQSKRRVILSIKQLSVNPWDEAKVAEGDIIDVTVAGIQEDGFKVTYEGLNGYMSKGTVKSRDPESVQEGEVLKVKVRVFNANKQRFIVSMRDAEEKVEKENFNKYMKSQDKLTNT